MKPLLRFALLGLLVLLLAALPLAMQYQTGSLDGTVAGRWGPVANATVEVRNLITGKVLVVKTDLLGHYLVRELRPGRYSLWVETPYHESVWVRRVVIERNMTTHQDIQFAAPIS